MGTSPHTPPTSRAQDWAGKGEALDVLGGVARSAAHAAVAEAHAGVPLDLDGGVGGVGEATPRVRGSSSRRCGSPRAAQYLHCTACGPASLRRLSPLSHQQNI